VIEDAKVACINRDKAKSELATIKQQAMKEKAEFEVSQPLVAYSLQQPGQASSLGGRPVRLTGSLRWMSV
jgi:hypothetical protein